MAARYRWDDFVIDLDAYRLERGGVPLALEPKAFNLLALLMQRPGHVFTKQEIFDQLWPNTAVSDHALTRVVAQLRRVLGDDIKIRPVAGRSGNADARYIETVPTRGYRWLPEVRAIDDAAPPSTAAAPAASPHRGSTDKFRLAATLLLIAALFMGMAAWTQRSARANANAPGARPAADVAWPVQLTTHPGVDLHPSFSPQGDAIAFASDRSGAFELYVRAVSGAAAEVPLTNDGQDNVQPAWSPDGSLIAFHSFGRGGVWVVPARGGIARQIAAEGSRPAWSADGKQIAFQSDEPSDATPSAYGAQSGATLRIVDADGRNQRGLTTRGQPLGGHAAPAWTRDGRFVAFTVFDGARNNGVWLVEVASGRVTQLARGVHNYFELAFAPDDSAIFAAGGEAVITRIAFDKMTVRAGARELIAVPGASGVRGLTMSPDGQRLAFTGLAISSQIWAQPIAPDGAGRGDPYPLTTDTSQRNSLPVVSADGSRVAYASTRGGEPPNVWVVDVEGKNGSQVTDSDSADAQPFWSPDGKRIAFVSPRGGHLGLWSVDLDTHREDLMVTLSDPGATMPAAGGGVLGEIAVSPSMSRVAMSIIGAPDANRRVFLSPIAPLDPVALSDARSWAGYPAWSRDERALAVEIKAGSSTHAGVVDTSTGALRQLTHERGQTWVRSWSPDGRKIAAAVFRGGRWGLRWIDARSGVSGAINAPSAPNGYVRYPEWSPRGDLVVYERGELHGNVWTMKLPER
jgi:Tol biopolymer transport system component/DNA-binding winged helix-turn-helix (wHTH) protein